MRAAVVTAGVPVGTMLVSVLASPAFAATHRYEGDDPGPGLTAAQTLGLFVGIPLLIIGVVYLLVFAGSGARGPRYRAGVAWRGEPQWWAGPAGTSGTSSTAGAADAAVAAATPTQGGGGARAHW
jgi:hypothetical protein